MVLELHIWGPACGLASIDPQCLATVAYLSQAISRDKWALVACSDATVSSTKELPALRDGTQWIGGFHNIVNHLRKRSFLVVDRGDEEEIADITAYSAFVESRGLPLLDLSLYVSSENYYASTRPAWAGLLRWPYKWLLPSQRRAIAKRRTQHLSLSALDLDSNSEEQNPRLSAADLIPVSLRSSRQTVSSLLNQPQHTSRFRLEALADSFLEPLQQLLGEKRYMIAKDGVSSLDCLTFAYLALALLPDVPQPWLANLMEARYPTLCVFVRDLNQTFFGGPIDPKDVFPSLQLDEAKDLDGDHLKNKKGGKSLQWMAPQKGRLMSAASAVVESIIHPIPILGHLYNPRVLRQESLQTGATEANPSEVASPPGESSNIPAILAISASLVGLGGYLLRAGIIGFSREDETQTLSNMGEIGSMLSQVDFRNYDSSLSAGGVRDGKVSVAETAVTLGEVGKA